MFIKIFLIIWTFYKDKNHDLQDRLLHTKLNIKIDVIPRGLFKFSSIWSKRRSVITAVI